MSAVTRQSVPLPRLLAALTAVLALTSSLAAAHMALADPPALRYKTNPYKVAEDYDYLSPLSPSGSNYPCKGYHTDLGTPGGKSVATYSPGGTYKIRLDGSATHLGGSCQLSFSFDGGRSWQVIKSFVGGCVKPQPGDDQSFSFTVPRGTPGGEALLAWTWFNNQGNREMYMNCAVVTVSGGRRKLMPRAEVNSLPSVEKRALGPQIFLANLGNGCSTRAGADVEFPDPGNSVERGGSGDTAAPVGDCGDVVVSGGGGGGGGGSGGKDCAFWRAQGYYCSGAIGVEVQRTLVVLVVVAAFAAALW